MFQGRQYFSCPHFLKYKIFFKIKSSFKYIAPSVFILLAVSIYCCCKSRLNRCGSSLWNRIRNYEQSDTVSPIVRAGYQGKMYLIIYIKIIIAAVPNSYEEGAQFRVPSPALSEETTFTQSQADPHERSHPQPHGNDEASEEHIIFDNVTLTRKITYTDLRDELNGTTFYSVSTDDETIMCSPHTDPLKCVWTSPTRFQKDCSSATVELEMISSSGGCHEIRVNKSFIFFTKLFYRCRAHLAQK